MGEWIGGNRTAIGVKQRVSIACAHDGRDRKNPVRSRLIFDDNRLLPTESQSLGEQAGRNSAPVPAGNGVMIRTLRCGQASAREDVGRIATAVEATAVNTTRSDAMARMSSSGVSVDVQNWLGPNGNGH